MARDDAKRARQIVTRGQIATRRITAAMARDDALDDDDDDELVDYEAMEAMDARRAVDARDEVEEGEVTARDARDARRADATTTRDDDAMLDVDDPTRVDMDARDFECAERVASLIEEPKRHLTRRLARAFGRDAMESALRETLRIERAGGSTYEAGAAGSGLWRRRTKAGCFLWVFKRAHDGAKLDAALRESRAVDRALKARRRGEFGRRTSARGRGRGRGRK